MTVREVMHAHIPTLFADSTVRDAVDKMDIYQFPALVILDDDARPLAVVTEGDLCRAAVRNDGVVAIARDPAIAHATADPVTVSGEIEIGDAYHRMLSSGLTILPVMEDDRMAGIVLRIDLMQAMILDAASDSR
jgi:CBS domain-containing protein